jgi:hypothetical protein
MRFRDLFSWPSRDASVRIASEDEPRKPSGEAGRAATGSNIDAEGLARWLRGLPPGDGSNQV